MPIVASASALRPIATRIPLIAITAVHALCRTIKAKLVALTSHALLFTRCSGETAVKFGEFLGGEAIYVPSYRRTKSLSSNSACGPSNAKTAYLACCSAKLPIKGSL
jgi:hypothetical protein